MVKVKKIQVTSKKLSQFNQFYSLALGDYLAARTLLLSGLLPQGVGLASTAVEKIFKAILCIRGEKISGHLKKPLLNSIKNYQPLLYAKLSSDFLEFLIEAYKLRYFDNLSPGYSLVISKYRTLAELDRTMCIIFSGLTTNQGQLNLPLPFEREKIERNPLLMNENYFIEDGSIERYFAFENFVQEIKIFSPYEWVTTTYRTYFGNNTGTFTKPVNTEKNKDGLKFKLSGG